MGKPAATVTHFHLCPKVDPGPKPHVGGPIITGSPDIFIGGLPAARKGDTAICIGAPPDTIAEGSATVFFNGKPAARLGDATDHGGRIVIGNPTFIIGDGRGEPELTASANLDHIPKTAQSFDEAEKRLETAADALQKARAQGEPLPRSPYSTGDKLKLLEDGLEERFIVRIIPRDHAGDEGMIGRPDARPAVYWTTTFTQVEHADHDARLICEAAGIDHTPNTEYTMLIIDQQAAREQSEMVSFFPTMDAIGEFMEETAMNDEDLAPIRHLIRPAMNPSYSFYYEHLHNTATEKGVNLDKSKKLTKLAKELGFNAEQRSLLKARHQLNRKFGANHQFLGCGMTNDVNAGNPNTPFGPVQQDMGYGIVEVYSYDKNPKTLGALEGKNILKRISLNN